MNNEDAIDFSPARSLSSQQMRKLGLRKPKWQTVKGPRTNIQIESLDRSKLVK